MFAKQIVVLLLIQVCLVSCQSKEKELMQETMIEIERLDLLRKKVNEFVSAKEASVLSKRREYESWKSVCFDTIKQCQSNIQKYEKALKKL